MRGVVLKHILVGSVVAASIGACSGEGCTSGCGGVTPLPGGFEPDARIENAGAIRITESGFGFLEDNLGAIASGVVDTDGGVMTFAIDETTGTVEIPVLPDVDYTVCPGGPTDNPLTCQVEIDVDALDLDFAPNGPNHLTVSGPLPVRLQNLPLDTDIGGGNISINAERDCPGGPGNGFAMIDATVRIALEVDDDPSHARFGYSRLRIEEISIDTSDIEDQLSMCGGFVATVGDFFRGFLIDQVAPGLTDTMRDTVEEQLCQKASPDVSPSCPEGTNDIDGICRYGTDAASDCVSMVLGTDGHAVLGQLLAGISPGTEGGLDFILAAGGSTMRPDGTGQWGDLDPVNGGATIGLYGGIEPRPLSQCVPLSTLTKPTGIPIPDELRSNTVAGWPASFPRPGQTGPDVSVAISEAFLNYAFSGMYNSGLLCLGITTETVGDLLNTGTVGIFAASLRDLTLQRENAPIAIVLRPTKAPHVEVGNGTDLATDPNLRLELPGIEFDFYVWSTDRFLRVFTAKFDLAVPANLEITPEGLQPVIEDVEVANGSVVNAGLLAEDPQMLADAIASLISGQVGSLLAGGIPPIDVSGALEGYGLRLALPPTVPGQGSPGLRKLTSGQHDFLAIFAALEATAPQAAIVDAWVERRTIDERGLRAETAAKAGAPVVVLGVDGSIEGEAEYQVKVDHGPWKPFVRASSAGAAAEISVTDDALRIEGHHTILVRGREVGRPYTLAEPVAVEVLIDTVAPEVEIDEASDGALSLDAFDVVTERDDLEARLAVGDGAFDAWRPIGEVSLPAAGGDDLTVQVRDEEGNVGTAVHAIIRGAPRDAGDGGCGCAVPGSSGSDRGAGTGAAAALALGGLAMVARARRRRRLLESRAAQAGAALVTLAVAGASPGCSCDETDPQNSSSSSSGGGGGSGPSCTNCTVLEPGLIGSYTSVAVDGDGTIWVAGYAEANWTQGYSWGDLVVGAWDGERVAWEVIDGVPAEPEPDPATFDTSAFRGGQIEPGEDVGLWTSIAASGDQLAVAYYDRTNRQLKLAVRGDDGWSTEVVESIANGDAGKYAELWFEGETPVIAYQAIEPAVEGFVTSKVRIARAGSSGGFQYEDVAVEPETPCRAETCSGGSVCLADTGECAGTATGCPECGDGEECIGAAGTPTCAAVLDDGKLDTYPFATGGYIAAARDPGGQIGLAWYDRVRGTLVAARKVNGAWTTQVVDGGGDEPSDVGIGATLAIDAAGAWHLAYVDGYDEALKYARLGADGSVASIEVVDDGVTVDGTPFADGKHIVGDDASILVTGSGDVRIAYQDATAGTLRVATGTASGDAHDWSLAAIPSEGVGGAFARILSTADGVRVAHWWRVGAGDPRGDVAIVSP
jgi:hypothetical protein